MSADAHRSTHSRESGNPAPGSRLRGDEREDSLATPMRRRLAGFARTLRSNGFHVGLAETSDALAVLASPAALRPTSLKPALRALFCATHSDWERFDEIFDAYWRGEGMRQRQILSAAPPAQAERRRAGLRRRMSRKKRSAFQIVSNGGATRAPSIPPMDAAAAKARRAPKSCRSPTCATSPTRTMSRPRTRLRRGLPALCVRGLFAASRSGAGAAAWI